MPNFYLSTIFGQYTHLCTSYRLTYNNKSCIYLGNINVEGAIIVFFFFFYMFAGVWLIKQADLKHTYFIWERVINNTLNMI